MIKPRPQVRPTLQIPTWVEEVLYTIVFVIVVTALFDMTIPRSVIDGSSMEPTFQDRDRLVVSRLHYLLSDPQRGDIVVFNSVEPRTIDDMLIKRVIAIPGDTLTIEDRRFYVNGELLDEPYIADEVCNLRCGDFTWQLADDEYFVMGDNRNHSNDSRAFDAIPIDHIVGRAIFRFWPITEIDLFSRPDY